MSLKGADEDKALGQMKFPGFGLNIDGSQSSTFQPYSVKQIKLDHEALKICLD